MSPLFKALTVANWHEPDPVGRHFVKISKTTGQVTQMTGDEWAKVLLAPRLTTEVPTELADLFHAAQGAMLYGYFFYPLYALGMAQLWRVADEALRVRFEGAGGPRSVTKFVGRIKWLESQGILDADMARQWNATRRLRNLASHPRSQSLQPPGEAATMVGVVAREINALFQ